MENYFITSEDLGTLNVEIRAEDINENVGSIKETLFVRKRSFIGNITAYLYEGIRKYLWAVLIFLAIAGYLLMPILEINIIGRKLKKAKLKLLSAEDIFSENFFRAQLTAPSFSSGAKVQVE